MNTDLLELVRAFEPADVLESQHRADIEALLTETAAPFSREQFYPGHITASVFLVRPGEVYLIHHKKLARWLQPGGHVEPEDRSVLAAAARELEEEVGVVSHALTLFDLDVHTIPVRKDEPEHKHFDVRFLCELPSDQTPRPSGEVLGGRFVGVDELLEDFVTDESVRRAARKLK